MSLSVATNGKQGGHDRRRVTVGFRDQVTRYYREIIENCEVNLQRK